MSGKLVAPQSEHDGRRKWLTLFILSLTLAIVIIDTTIVNVTIPAIQAEFNTPLHQIEWISALYALVYAALIISWGRLADAYGRRRIFVAGVVTFALGSAIVGTAHSLALLLAGRFVQGFGAAMTSPSTLSIVSTTFTGRARGVAFGIWGAVAGAAGGLGPLLGGFLTTYGTWRWAFLINLPIALIAIVGSVLWVDESRAGDRPSSLDPAGIVLASLGLAALVFGLIEGQTYGWLRPTDTFAIGGFAWPSGRIAVAPVAFVLAAVLLAGFVLHDVRLARRGGQPLFDFSLLNYRSFRFGLLTILIVALGEFGIFFVLAIYLQEVRGLTAFQTGLVYLPFSVTTFVSAPLAGTLAARLGPRWVVTLGMLLEAVGIYALSRMIGLTTPFSLFVVPEIVYGVGVGFAIAQLTNITLTDVPHQYAGASSGANNTVRQLGAAIGIAILGAVLTGQIAAVGRAEAAGAALPATARQTIEQQLSQGLAVGSQNPVAGSLDAQSTQAVHQIVGDAMTSGARSASAVAAVFSLLGALSSLFIPAARRPRPAT